MREQLFPDAWREGQDDRISLMWDLSYPLPTPKREMPCPVCSHPMVMKDWKFHLRTTSGTSSPWRVDVRMKCMGCSHVPIFGIAISEDYYDQGQRVLDHGRTWITWRKGKAALAKAGFFDD